MEYNIVTIGHLCSVDYLILKDHLSKLKTFKMVKSDYETQYLAPTENENEYFVAMCEDRHGVRDRYYVNIELIKGAYYEN